ncbi:sugar ABC transporter substrate-binding protein [Virgibacillus halodenitrificans]|uniref:sugar ABC transporter substrate-binding protein n=1 Tax=Virgibacillus halodenitrificans TaxID=1482 RepID=UPI0002D5DA32|nr:sugar ABC transporter substrate-binding protein [Virgibacillus halodenitrificans]MYL55936.1 extracellular solute-binding protein [Virgibacillus halodenitrificans]WHX26234.1 sugar ABC transporter substrate-binding protein [Virgibacillus halodenitrificans]CDQ31338.1 Cyclodextrin-binding protein precursor [Virgibacillus halodenitrificans]
MMKKFSFLILLIVIGLVTVGCSDDTSGKAENEVGGEITVWAHPYTGDAEKEEEMWDEIIASFKEEFDAEVNLEIIPWANRDQKILTALAANNGPDIFYAIPDQMPQYADEGMLLELDPYLEDFDMSDFVDTALVSTTWQDKIYGLPILQEAYTFFYNKDVVEAIGEDPEKLPETWEEFEDWAAKAKEEGMYATSFQGGGSMNGTLYPYLWQAGGDVITEENEVLINNEAGVEAFSFINKMYENGWIPEDSITAMEHNAIWDSGEMLAVLGSGITLSQLQDKGVIDFAIGAPLKNKEQVTYGTTGMFVIPSNTDNPATAAEFVKVLTNAENQRTFNEVTQYIPTRESAKDIFDEQPYLAQLASYTEYALPGVIHPKGRDIMPMIQAELQTMMEGKKNPQEAADAAAEAIKGAISQ